MHWSPVRRPAWDTNWCASLSATGNDRPGDGAALDRLEALAAELPAGRVEILAGDLTDPAFRQRLWDSRRALPGGLDLLVNNAGIGNYAEFVDQDPQAIRQIIELNLIALIDLSQKAARHMKAGGRPDSPDLLGSRLYRNSAIRRST